MNQEEQFSSQFATGVKNKFGHGVLQSEILGEQLETFQPNGTHLSRFLINKLDLKNTQDLEDGMIQTCFRLVMQD
jgi:hypothetical protein